MRNQLRDSQTVNVLCKDHKQKCMFVCLHKTCAHSFKIGCPKCRKDHGQHPNRLISLVDFHKMLAKPIRYLENITAFKLMNLKTKNEYIRKFRTHILEKESQLIQSNQQIKSTISSILEQHYFIRSVISHIDPEAIVHNHDDYIDHLQKCRDFMAYNPVKGDLVFNNEVIKRSRVVLEKHLKQSHELIDNIRQFLVKIIEVLMANCLHEEDDDDIQFENEGDSQTTFNIYIKARTDVIQTPNIKNKLEHETFLEMFDEEKEALNQEVQILEKELDFKMNILNKIKSTSHIKDKSEEGRNQSELESREELEKEELKETNMRYTADSLFEKQKFDNQMTELKEQYQGIVESKEEYIMELKNICHNMEERINVLEEEARADPSEVRSSKLLEENQIIIDEYEYSNSVLKEQLEEMDEVKKIDQQTLQRKESEMNQLKNRLEDFEGKQQQKEEDVEVRRNDEEVKRRIFKMEEDLRKKDTEIGKQKKKYCELEKLVDKMKENNEESEKELMQWRDQHEQREKMLRLEMENGYKEIDSLQVKIKSGNDKIKHLQIISGEKTLEMESKTQALNQKEKELLQKLKQIKKSQQNEENNKKQTLELSKKEQLLKQQGKSLFKREEQLIKETRKLTDRQKQNEMSMRLSHKTESTSKTAEEESKKMKGLREQQNKKIREMKEMLEISIRKNQELKDKNYQLENDFENYKHQSDPQSRQSYRSDGRKSFCEERSMRNNTDSDQMVPEEFKLKTVSTSQYLDLPSPTFKKQDEATLRDRKIFTNREDKKQAYHEFKTLFKTVAEDIGILEERLKENTVIQKVYLKQLERKRNENKTLKKELENIKLYGSHLKHTDIQRATSPLRKGIDKDKHDPKGTQPPLAAQSGSKGESQAGMPKKYPKGLK